MHPVGGVWPLSAALGVSCCRRCGTQSWRDLATNASQRCVRNSSWSRTWPWGPCVKQTNTSWDETATNKIEQTMDPITPNDITSHNYCCNHRLIHTFRFHSHLSLSKPNSVKKKTQRSTTLMRHASGDPALIVLVFPVDWRRFHTSCQGRGVLEVIERLRMTHRHLRMEAARLQVRRYARLKQLTVMTLSAYLKCLWKLSKRQKH